MSFDCDVDDMEDDEVAYSEYTGEDSGGGEYPESYEDIDFEALGIDPSAPTHAKPGTEEKVLMLAARYAAGVPLWHDSDCYDHGPGQSLTKLAQLKK